MVSRPHRRPDMNSAPSPEEFKTFAKSNAEIKISQWKTYDGLT
jgi:hypothetical protein